MSRIRTLTPNFTVFTLKMWAYTVKIAKICNFWYKFSQKGYTSLSDFLEIKREEGYLKSVPSGQISPLSLLKCGLTTPKIAESETGNFWYKFAQKGYTPYAIFTKFGLGEGVSGSHPHAKFRHCVLKNVGVQPPKSPKLVFFGINLPFSDFYVLPGRGSPRTAPSYQI